MNALPFMTTLAVAGFGFDLHAVEVDDHVGQVGRPAAGLVDEVDLAGDRPRGGGDGQGDGREGEQTAHAHTSNE